MVLFLHSDTKCETPIDLVTSSADMTRAPKIGRLSVRKVRPPPWRCHEPSRFKFQPQMMLIAELARKWERKKLGPRDAGGKGYLHVGELIAMSGPVHNPKN